MLLSVFPCAACSSLLWGVCWPGVGAPSDLLRCCWLLFSVVAPVEAPGQPPTMGSGQRDGVIAVVPPLHLPLLSLEIACVLIVLNIFPLLSFNCCKWVSIVYILIIHS